MHALQRNVLAQNWLFANNSRQTLTDPDKILKAHVGRTQISCVKILAPWAKEAQNGGEKKWMIFVTVTTNSLFATEQISTKFKQKRYSVCSIEP